MGCTATSAFLLVELVLAATSLVASLAIICAQYQSTSIYKSRDGPQWEWCVYCLLSLAVTMSSVAALFSLSNNSRRYFIYVHFVLLGAMCIFIGRCLIYAAVDTDSDNFNWMISVTSLSSVQLFLLVAFGCELRTLQQL